MSEEKIWWYAKGNSKFGPHTSAELKSLAASRQIGLTDMIWKEGLTSWLPASSVKGLIPASVGAAPPPLPNSAAGAAPAAARMPPALTPNPKPRKSNAATKTMLWIGGGFFALIILALIFGGNSKQGSSPSQAARGQTASSEQPAAALKVGDTLSTPTFEIRVDSAQLRSSVGRSPFSSQPSEGAVYVAIQVSYKNISQKPVNAFSTPSIHLKAPDGTKYDSDIGAAGSYATELNLDSKAFSDLNPAIRVRDAEVFEVSRELFDPKTWKILIEADDDLEVEFLVAEQKVQVAPPPVETTPLPPPPTQSEPTTQPAVIEKVATQAPPESAVQSAKTAPSVTEVSQASAQKEPTPSEKPEMPLEQAASEPAHSPPKIGMSVSADYFRRAQSALSRNVVYPPRAADAGEEGDCQVRITFDRSGTISSSELARSSSFETLDQACIDAVRRTGRFPPVAASEAPGTPYFAVVLAISFSLEQGD